MEPDRRILIVDSPGRELQPLAMELLSRDFEVHYASDVDEAQLLAAETDGKINVVLFTAGVELEHVPDLAARFGVRADALIPFGLRPPEHVVRALHHHGVRWHLWDDPEDASIRCVISGVLHDHDPFELHYHLRVPTKLAAHFEVDGRKAETSIRDIGLGGACLVGGVVGEVGDYGELRFRVGIHEVSIPTRTAWTTPDDDGSLRIGGVSFQEIDHETGLVIDELLESVLSRHRIQL